MSISVFRENDWIKVDNIYIIKTFMPFPLQENNCFLAESDNGWIVIDTGVNIDQNKDIWQRTLTDIGISFKQIKVIILTHYHHDHMGLAGWMQQLSGAKVLLPREDIITFNTYIAGNYYEQIKLDCQQAGWSEDLIRDLEADVNSIEPLVKPFPEISILEENYSFRFGDAYCSGYPLPGHTDGHVVFYSFQNQILFSGDNIVPHTILHLTDWPHTRMVNPLYSHMMGLDRLTDLSVKKIIPGHGDIFYNLQERVKIIKQHHMRRKEYIFNGLTDGDTAWDLASSIFKNSNYIHIKRLVLAETLAYLEALHAEGLINKETVEQKTIYTKNLEK